MTIPGPAQRRRLLLYATGEHSCSYLDDRLARTAFVDPEYPLDNETYAMLLRQGMRRSGEFVYQPSCPGCAACLSLRIPVTGFRPNRSQRRCWKRNQDLQVVPRPPVFDKAHFALYHRYLAHRHPGSGMDDPQPERFMEFLTAGWAKTVFYEFRDGPGRLGGAVADRVSPRVGAGYTLLRPGPPERGLGTLSILWQVREAERLGLPHVYLGYWIAEAPTMRYKTRFRPAEVYSGGRWTPLDAGGTD
ncbi:MAG: arginyltransferase [Ectothiorhodospiraceae bacterium]|nr:arginyltransferase [Ectothiorhodospiraceae bacterium]